MASNKFCRTHKVIYYFKVSWGRNQHLASDKRCRPHKLCVGHSIDLLGHIVFQQKLGTEPTNGKQQNFWPHKVI
jgi:hypothetical protein